MYMCVFVSIYVYVYVYIRVERGLFSVNIGTYIIHIYVNTCTYVCQYSQKRKTSIYLFTMNVR